MYGKKKDDGWPSAIDMAKEFHRWYEYLAPKFRLYSPHEKPVPWMDLRANIRNLLINTCEHILDWIKNYKEEYDGKC